MKAVGDSAAAAAEFELLPAIDGAARISESLRLVTENALRIESQMDRFANHTHDHTGAEHVLDEVAKLVDIAVAFSKTADPTRGRASAVVASDTLVLK